jgi:tetraacyldisaccharide 4'-kinase
MPFRYRFVSWLEMTIFRPRGFLSFFFIFSLLPFSYLYGFVMYIRRLILFSKQVDLGIDIISIGNITIGGNGKTPFIISLANELEDVCIVSRGYGRFSSGLVEVSKKGELSSDVKQSGDEAYMLAQMCPKASVIVSEDRVQAIKKAKQNGSKVVILDDGFSKVKIKKVDILLHSKDRPTFEFCLPSGSFREFSFVSKKADLNLYEDVDFKREVFIKNEDVDLVLITSISKPQRLSQYMPKNVIKSYYFPDHHNFKKDEIETLMRVHKDAKIICTQKDAVKLEAFDLELIIINLHIKINGATLEKIKLLSKLK